MTNLAEMRAKLKAQAERTSNTTRRTSGDGASYPFWNIPVDTTATLRFLPDGDPDNVFFFQKREIIKMPFAGVLGQSGDQVEVQVPCNEMFGGKCPVVERIRPWWNDEAQKQIARIYWKKVSFIYQGFVVDSPLTEDNAPENPIRRFVLNKSIHDIVLAHLNDEEVENSPVDYEFGNDFRIASKRKGNYNDYTTSSFSRKSRALSQFERDAIEEHGLFDLKEYKGAQPSEDHVAAIAAMLEDSLAGRAFDLQSYGQYYRPFGVSYDAVSSDAPAQVVRNVAAATQAAPSVDEGVTTLTEANANDVNSILAMVQAKSRGSN